MLWCKIMADDGFNGSTISFASGDMVPLRDIRYADACAKVDISGAADGIKTYVGGLPDPEITFEIVGGSTIVAGDTGAIVIAFNDGGGPTGALAATWLVTSVDTGGSIDSELTSSFTCVPATAPA